MRRRRFGRPAWIRWAWAAVAGVGIVGVSIGAISYVKHQYRSARNGSITRLLDSSRASEKEGHLDLALVDLDAALELAHQSGPPSGASMEDLTAHRGELARREAEKVLAELEQSGARPFPLGDWLNLVARTQKDPDLKVLAARVDQGFQQSVRQEAGRELASARHNFDTRQVVESLRGCDRIAALVPHLTGSEADGLRRDASELATRLVEGHGVAIETTRGEFVLGSQESYRSSLLPVLIKALEAKGYLPSRESSPWRSAWTGAKYRLRMQVSERREGNYMSSQNRLTRIEARVSLTSGDRLVWQTIPTARTAVPLPRLPVQLSTQIAASLERRDDIERLLYENARGQIDEKFSYALGNMPPCCP